MSARPPRDPLLLAPPHLLALLGLVLATAPALASGEHATAPLTRHIVRLALGAAAFSGARFVRVDRLGTPAFVLGLIAATIAALLSPGIAVGRGGAFAAVLRWLTRGLDVELAKFASVLFTALLLARREKRVAQYDAVARRVLLFVGGVAFIAVVMAGPAAALVVFGVPLLLLRAAGVPLAHLARVCGAAAPWAYFGWVLRAHRSWSVLSSWFGTAGEAAARHSAAVLRSASLTGDGLGAEPSLGLGGGPFLPDLTFTVVVEMLGWLGGALVIALFAILFLRGRAAAARSPDQFRRFLGTGLALTLGAQAFLHVAICFALLPPWRQALPFLGDDLALTVGSMFSVGLLHSIPRAAAGDQS